MRSRVRAPERVEPARLESDAEHCHRCDATTRWIALRGGRRLRCEGCGDVFPCRSRSYGHADCSEARGGAS